VKCNRTLRYELRHGSASAPEHAGSVFLRFCCSVPPSPRHHAFFFDLAGGFLFLDSVWWWRARSGFSKGEIDGILSANSVDEVLAKLFFGDIDLAKLRLHFPPAERGLGNECGRIDFLNLLWRGRDFTKTYFLIKYKKLQFYGLSPRKRHSDKQN